LGFIEGFLMPIYDYQCSSCGHADEVMRKISDVSTAACPVCGKATFAKQLSAPSFQLNGSGWYATDFKHGDKKAAKPDTKPDTKTSPAASAPISTPSPAKAS
jgi:putative FmdB family regulatory protein